MIKNIVFTLLKQQIGIKISQIYLSYSRELDY
mgnify:FL=1